MTFSGLTLLAILVACCYSGCHGNDGQMLSIAQPGSNLVLSCPHGQEINIIATNATTFPHKHLGGVQGYCSSINCSDCIDCSHPLLLEYSKSVCDNLQQCRLMKPGIKELVCDEDKPHMVTALYRCENKFPDKKTVIACDGEEANLKCEKGHIHIIKFNYGRLDMNTCTNKTSEKTYCTDRTERAIAKDTCEGQKSCEFLVDPDKMPPTFNCDDNPKYVYVSYVCKE